MLIREVMAISDHDKPMMKVSPTKVPKFRNGTVHSWDTITVILDGREVEGWVETTYGAWVYFKPKPGGRWHKTSVTNITASEWKCIIPREI